MDGVNKTLYIPLYGKALVSRQGLLLEDPKAEEIWTLAGFPLKGKAKSKWLAYNMGMRARVFDDWVREKMAEFPDAVLLHLGCGMDSRCLRVGTRGHMWYDVDFPDVIEQRKRFYAETDQYRMIASDIREKAWLEGLPGGQAIVVMEGISMYLTHQELLELLQALTAHFRSVALLADVYTEFAAKATKYKNPINEVGVTQVYGLDDPKLLESAGLEWIAEHSLTPDHLIAQLPRREQGFFRTMFAGSLARKIYCLYEYKNAPR